MIIHALDYARDPTTLLLALLDQDWPILLDSTGLGRYDIISANPTDKITAPNWEQLKQLLATHDAQPSDLPFTGGAMGYFGYDANLTSGPITPRITNDIHLPTIAVGLYDWAIVTDHKQQATYYVHQHDDEQHWHWLQNKLEQTPTITPFALTETFTANQSQRSYIEAFNKIKDYITAGDCYQVNLAQRFSAPFDGDAFNAYRLLREHNPAPFSAFMRLEMGDVISCSPERFIQCHDGLVETNPIKGTMPRDDDSITDNINAITLQNSEKDRAENLMIVDLLRNDLGRSCQVGSVQVPKLFELQSYRAVHHLVSTVTGTLEPDLTPVDLLQRAFPGGSITGAPKIRAMQIIEELEHYRRSIYCGSIGYIGYDGSMDSNIAIRSCVAQNNTLYCWAGGGIVADSTAQAEYQETLDKISRITATLNATISRLDPGSEDILWHRDINNVIPAPSDNIKQWLTQPYILTEAMERHCDNLSMALLSMTFDQAFEDEIDKLNQDGPYMIRRVAFYGDKQPWTYGRVIIPNTTYLSQQSAFDNLVNKPMGVNLLYNNPDVTRSDFEYSHITSPQDAALEDFDTPIYARRSIFTWSQHPLLIIEYFNDSLPAYILT